MLENRVSFHLPTNSEQLSAALSYFLSYTPLYANSYPISYLPYLGMVAQLQLNVRKDVHPVGLQRGQGLVELVIVGEVRSPCGQERNEE